MRRFATTLALATSTLIALTTTAATPATAAVVAYRVDLYAEYAAYAWTEYNANLTAALVTDVARVFGTSASAVTLKDCVPLVDDFVTNVSAVFTVDGGSDAAFLASPREAAATWTNETNVLLYNVWWGMANREAAAAFYIADSKIAYISNVARVDGQLPNTRFLEVTLSGKHLVTAAANVNWNDSLIWDLAEVFSIPASSEGAAIIASSRFALTNFNFSGVNNSVLTVRFTVKPLLDAAVATTTFFASTGTVAWLSQCMNIHTNAAYADLGIESRDAIAMVDLAGETALTVTSTGVAPGDEAYTNAPGPTTNAPATTNAPGGAAVGVQGFAFAVAAAALVCASIAAF